MPLVASAIIALELRHDTPSKASVARLSLLHALGCLCVPELDVAVAAAYGIAANSTDDEILQLLCSLNERRSQSEDEAPE